MVMTLGGKGEAPGSMSSRGLGRLGVMLLVSRKAVRSLRLHHQALRAASRSVWVLPFFRSLVHRSDRVGYF
ncbi:hypothetical protein BN10_590074 [Phycicoccus elongatus Lp2]|uniref:Uncharacterized protein n=1 Tax=Phycicoccus elongatus Lp2 TaxID=1193181 RepID=N0E0Z4_9MICO|nr:hypothetical protein BN10_590074 [Phycicoccus elongatus Lp2]